MSNFDKRACKKYLACPKCRRSGVEWTPQYGWHCLWADCQWHEGKITGPGYYKYLTGSCMTPDEIDKFENPLFYGWTKAEKEESDEKNNTT